MYEYVTARELFELIQQGSQIEKDQLEYVELDGWVRTNRNNGSIGFIELNDGKVTGIKHLNNKTSYQYEDDQNIYLKELKYSELNNDSLNINYYSTSNEPVNLKIVYKNNL